MNNIRNFILLFIIVAAQSLNANKTLPESGFFSRRHLLTKLYFLATFNREEKIRQAIEDNDLEKFKQLWVKEDLLAIDNLLEDLISENKVEFVDYIAHEANVDINQFINSRKEKGLSKPFLIGLFAKYGSTALNMKDLLKNEGLEFDEHDESGNNLLHIAVAQDDELLIEELSKEPTINKNEFNDKGQTPLDVAVAQDTPHLLPKLKKAGVDFDRHDNAMRSVGQRALEADCSPRVFKALLESGLEVGSSEQNESVANLIMRNRFKNLVEGYETSTNPQELYENKITGRKYAIREAILKEWLAKRKADALKQENDLKKAKIDSVYLEKQRELELFRETLLKEEESVAEKKRLEENELEQNDEMCALIMQDLNETGNNIIDGTH